MSLEGRQEGGVSAGAANVEATAAEWFGRRQFWSWTAEDERKLDAWLAESLAHQIAYWRLVATWQRTERLQAVRLQRPLSARSVKGGTGTKGVRFLAAVAAVVLLIALLATVAPTFQDKEQVFATGLGETRSLALNDGSRIELNTNSLLRVNFGEGKRQVTLERGEAYFQIEHDSAHPFTVTANGHRITDLGTKFLVRDEGTALRVTLFEGEARLDSQQAGRGPQSAVLKPGDVAVATAGSLSVARQAPQSITSALAWRSGAIILGEHATLSDAITEFNRYNQTKLVIEDPSIAQTPIAGRFATNGVRRFADVVTNVFGLHVREEPNRIVVKH